MPGVIVVRTRGNVPSSGTIANAGVASAVTAAHDTTGAGRAYYISPTGSDTTGSGSFSSPWATIGKFVASSRQPGDTLYCRGGTYTETPVASIGAAGTIQGTASAPITIRNYPGETPVFVGPTTGVYKQFLFISWGTAYLVVDGLTAQDFQCTDASLCDIGETAGRTALVHHITIRNCTFTGKATGSQGEHGVYISEYASDITIEDNRIVGPYPGQADGLTGAGIHVFHYPAPTNLLIQRNIITNWSEGIQLWDSATTKTLTAQLLHNSFLDNNTNIDARYHSTLLVRDNAGEDAVAGTAYNLSDPYNSAATTADHNFWAQTFNPDYTLAPGSTGIDAASDGTDAGALDTVAAYYVSPTGSDTSGDGSYDYPWATINKFVAKPALPGDTLYCRGGTYSNTAPINLYALPGTSSAPITIRNYPGETPALVGPSYYDGYAFKIDRGSSYIVIDGFEFSAFDCSNAVIWIGNTDPATGEAATTRTHHITIRNCTITKDPDGDALNYGIYCSWMSDDLTIEDCHFTGQVAHNGSANAAIHVYHPPAPRNILIQRNIFEDWHDGIMVADISPATCTGDILHNSFLDCETNINLWRHAADFVVRDNAGEDGTAAELVDSNTPYATADHNFWTQTFDANYYLESGNTGVLAASDGTDAGALHLAGRGATAAATATGSAYAATFVAEDSSYEAVCLLDSPSFLLPMDESSGTLTDIVGSLTTTAYGTPTYGVTGPVTGHTAIQFDASGDYFTIADNDALDLGDGPFTIEWWMARDTDTGSWQFMFAKGTFGYGVGIDSEDLVAMVKSGVAQLAVYTGETIPADSNWHYYAVTRSATRGAGSTTIYIDGVDIDNSEPSSSTELANTTDALTIGSESGTTNPARSRIAYIGFYKSVLSSTRIAAHYDARTLG